MSIRILPIALLSAALLLACGSKAPEPAPAAAPPAEPQLDRVTLLKIAQERLKAPGSFTSSAAPHRWQTRAGTREW